MLMEGHLGCQSGNSSSLQNQMVMMQQLPMKLMHWLGKANLPLFQVGHLH